VNLSLVHGGVTANKRSSLIIASMTIDRTLVHDVTHWEDTDLLLANTKEKVRKKS